MVVETSIRLAISLVVILISDLEIGLNKARQTISRASFHTWN
jgi:hypothetical protein